MIKKQTMRYLAGMGLLLWMQMAQTTVYAGTINANEQRIINYYSKTFYYKGKAYVATESAKQAAYSKLAADDVDLTSKEAGSYILQLSANVKQGIAEGYLVEVQSGDSGNSNSGTGDSETPSKPDSGNGDAGTSTKPDTGDTDTGNNTGADSKPDSGNTDTGDDTGTDSKPDTGGDGTNNSNREEVPPGFVGPFPIAPGEEGDVINKDNTEITNPQPSAGGNQSASGDDDGWSTLSGGQTTGSTGEVTSQDSGSGEDTMSPEGNGSSEEMVIDLQNLLEKAKQNSKKYVFYDQNNNVIEPEDLEQALQEGPVTVKDYADGKMKIIDESGQVLFESSIPDKGIRLEQGSGWILGVIVLMGLAVILIVLRGIQKIRKRGRKNG